MRAAIKFFINEEKKSKKNGKLPLYVRITTNGKKAEKKLGLIDERDFSKWQPDTMRFTDSKMQINRLITAWQRGFDDIIYRELNETKYSASELRDFISGKKNTKETTIVEFAENYYRNVVLSNQSLVYNTRKGYNKAKNHLLKFLECEGLSQAKISVLGLPLALKFKDYLLSTNETVKKKAMLEQSAATVIKKLRIIFDRAMDEEMIPNNPFNKIKLKNGSPQKPRLNIHQVKALFILDLSNNETLKKYRDTFLFSILTGLAHCDTFVLKHSNLIETSWGKKLYIKRSKTGTIF